MPTNTNAIANTQCERTLAVCICNCQSLLFVLMSFVKLNGIKSDLFIGVKLVFPKFLGFLSTQYAKDNFILSEF